VEALIKKPYTEGGMPTPSPADTATPTPAKGKQADVPAPASGEKPTLKKPNP